MQARCQAQRAPLAAGRPATGLTLLRGELLGPPRRPARPVPLARAPTNPPSRLGCPLAAGTPRRPRAARRAAPPPPRAFKGGEGEPARERQQPAQPAAAVTFKAARHLPYGQVLKVVGGAPQLGDWDVGAAPGEPRCTGHVGGMAGMAGAFLACGDLHGCSSLLRRPAGAPTLGHGCAFGRRGGRDLRGPTPACQSSCILASPAPPAHPCSPCHPHAPSLPAAMQWGEGDQWLLSLDLPPGAAQFKLVAAPAKPERGGEQEWEAGPNRELQVRPVLGASLAPQGPRFLGSRWVAWLPAAGATGRAPAAGQLPRQLLGRPPPAASPPAPTPTHPPLATHPPSLCQVPEAVASAHGAFTIVCEWGHTGAGLETLPQEELAAPGEPHGAWACRPLGGGRPGCGARTLPQPAHPADLTAMLLGARRCLQAWPRPPTTMSRAARCGPRTCGRSPTRKTATRVGGWVGGWVGARAWGRGAAHADGGALTLQRACRDGAGRP